ISGLTQNLRLHVEESQHRETRTGILLELSRKLSRSRSKADIAESTVESVSSLCGGESLLYLLGANEELVRPGEEGPITAAEAAFRTQLREALGKGGVENLDDTGWKLTLVFPLESP